MSGFEYAGDEPTLFDLKAELVLAGRFRLVRRVGRGGMGDVWLAEDTALDGRRVALKVLRPEMAGDTGGVADLKHEVVVTRELRHPDIVGVYDLHDAGGVVFISMEFVDGRSLAEALALRGRRPFPLAEVLPWARQVASALDCAHGRGVLHRDVKPGNMLLGGDGAVKLADFGIARVVKDTVTRQTGRAASGTLVYMSPQQLMDERKHRADPRNDVYSFAASLYELLSGEPPFSSGDISTQIMLKHPEPVEGVPDHVNDALLQGLAKEIGDRPANCTALVENLSGEAARRAEEARKAEEARRQEEQRRREETRRKREEAEAEQRRWQENEERQRREEEERRRLAREREDAPSAPSFKTGPWALLVVVVLLVGILVLGGAGLVSQLNSGSRVTRTSPPEPQWAVIVPPAEEQAATGNISDTESVSDSPLASSETGSPAGAGHIPGEVRTVDLGGGVKLEMVWIPPGSFMMGSPASEEGRDDDETQHQVEITQGFWMSKHEVTQSQWESVMGSNPSRFKGADRPVESVSWGDCQSFLERLNSRVSGGGFRLPTEAEWEYACRAGTTTPFHFGATLSTDQANYNGNYTYGNGRAGVYRQETTPVGSFPANAWGLHDMHGNVWEWCQDWYAADFYSRSSGRDPENTTKSANRVLRGGSWLDTPRHCRSANRDWGLPGLTSDLIGFRVVLVASRAS